MPHTKNMNLVNLVDHFHSEEKCRAYLENLRWPKGKIVCPRCGNKSISRIEDRQQYDCNSCRYQFSVTAGTIFHDSHLPLWKWFLATYTMIESKKGVSANQIKRMLKVSYKTAWYLCHRIRAAMSEAKPEPLSGTVEADETWVGGKAKGRSGKGRGGKGEYRTKKAMVLGVVERGGRVRLQYEGEEAYKEVLQAFLRRNLRPDTERIITDDWAGYKGIADNDTRHSIIRHASGQYVVGDVHTNTIEGVWSLLNRSIVGSYHKISVKHLDAYLDELEWRFNNRKNPFLFRETLRKLLTSSVLPYRILTANGDSPVNQKNQ